MIELSQVSHSYDQKKTWILQNISLTIKSGEILILLGSSGSGKTSLLKMLNGLIKPTRGDIEIDGVNIDQQNPVELRRHIGYVFQRIGLFPHMTIANNIGIVMQLAKVPRDKRQEKIKMLMDFVNLPFEKFAHRFPDELSGGQGQRIGFARALANDPNYLLMDEPFGALDNITRHDLQTDLLALQKKLHKTIVLVTHDLLEAFRLGDRIAILDQGQLVQVGTKQNIIQHPATPFVKNLVDTHTQQLKHYHDDKL